MIRKPWSPSTTLAALVALALVVRAVSAFRTYVPGRDGATYLWIADRVAHGDLAAAFQTVFHPLYALLCAPVLVVLPGADPVLVGQAVSGTLGALATIPLFALTRRMFGDHAAAAAGLFYAVGVWFARHPADCMSEGPYYLFACWTAHALVCRDGARSAAVAGLFCALAYGTRPEGAALAAIGIPWLLARGDRRRCVAFAGVAFAAGMLLPLGWALYGDGFTLTPKAAFNYAVGAGRDEGGGGVFYAVNLLKVPGHVFEAVGYVATAMAFVGVIRSRPLRLRDATTFLVALFVLQVLVIPFVRSTIRFVSGYGVLLLPFAGRAWRDVRPWFATRSPGLLVAAVLVAVLPDLVRIPQARRDDKLVLRELGTYLRARLEPHEKLVSAERRARSAVTLPFSMSRVEYFAGVKPSPPRPLDPAEILAVAADPDARFALIAGERPLVTFEEIARYGFRPHELPDGLRQRAAEREIAVYERPR